jgi:hypothetical protein
MVFPLTGMPAASAATASGGGGDASAATTTTTTTTENSNGGVAGTNQQGVTSQTPATPGEGQRKIGDIIADIQKRIDASNGKPDAAATADTKTQQATTTDEGGQVKDGQQAAADGVTDGEQEVETPSGQKLKIDGAASARKWGEEWRKSATEYKTAHDFIDQNFGGDIEAAKMAVEVFNAVASDNFDPAKTVETFKKLSPQRTTALQNFISEQNKDAVKETVLKELFGDKVKPEEVEAFRKYKEVGGNLAMFGDADNVDIPEELKFNEDGSKKTDKEIEFLRQMKQDAIRNAKAIASEKDARIKKEKLEAQNQLNSAVETFVNQRTDVINQLADEFGLKPVKGEKPEITQKKETLRGILNYATLGLFGQDEKAVADYQSAMMHLANNEPLLANQYSRRIENHLLKAASTVAETLGEVLLLHAEGVEKQHANATTGRVEVSGGSPANTAATANAGRKTFGDRAAMQAELNDILNRVGKK